MNWYQFGLLAVLLFIIFIYIIPNYFRIIGYNLARGINIFIDEQFDAFYEMKIKSEPEKKESKNG